MMRRLGVFRIQTFVLVLVLSLTGSAWGDDVPTSSADVEASKGESRRVLVGLAEGEIRELFISERAIEVSRQAMRLQSPPVTGHDMGGACGFGVGSGLVDSSVASGLSDPDSEFAEGVFEGRPSTQLRRATIAIDTDYEFFVQSGGTVESASIEVLTIMDEVNTIYERDVDVTHEVVFIRIRETPEDDPYTAPNADFLLAWIEQFWESDPQLSAIERDVVHLISGRRLPASTVIGRANNAVVCSDPGQAYGFSIVDSLFDVQKVGLVAHELGHGWGATHCNEENPPRTPCRIMCSSLDLCQGLGAPEFALFSIQSIRNYVNMPGVICLLERCEGDLDEDQQASVSDIDVLLDGVKVLVDVNEDGVFDFLDVVLALGLLELGCG